MNVHDQQGSTSREVTMYKRPISEISDEHEIRADELCTFQNIEFNLLVQCIGSSVLNWKYEFGYGSVETSSSSWKKNLLP